MISICVFFAGLCPECSVKLNYHHQRLEYRKPLALESRAAGDLTPMSISSCDQGSSSPRIELGIAPSSSQSSLRKETPEDRDRAFEEKLDSLLNELLV